MTSITNRDSKKTLLTYIPVFIGICIFFWLSIPGNKSETDDAFAYASAVRADGFVHLFSPRYLLFLPLAKLFHQFLSVLGLSGDQYSSMIWLSIISSGLTIIFCHRILLKIFNVGFALATWACVFLVVCYGFWRYSVEAEVYALSNLLCISVFYILLKQTPRMPDLGHLIIAGILAAFSALVYKPNVIPVLLCYPMYFLLKRQWKALFVYGISACTCLAVVYYFVFLQVRPPMGFVSYLLSGASRSSGSPLMTVFVFFSNIFTTNFIFGFEPVQHFISSKFPSNIISEEVFAASHNVAFNRVGAVTLVLSGIAFAWLLIAGAKHLRKRSLLPAEFLLISWLVVYAITLLFLDPNSPEPWTMVIVPTVLLISSVLVRPLFERNRRKLPYIFVSLLFLHNFFAGYQLVSRPSSDYGRFVAGWLVKNSKPGDLVLSLGSRYTLTYIQYKTDAGLCAPEQFFDRCIAEAELAIRSGHRVFILQDMVEPDPVVKARHPETFNKTTAFIARYRQYLVQVSGADKDRIYELQYTGSLK